MGYKIYYGPKKRSRGIRLYQIMISVAILISCVFCRFYWPQGRAILQKYLLPQVQESSQSLADLVSELESGTNLQDAITVFLEEVIYGTS